jgi:hypothetical protein
MDEFKRQAYLSAMGIQLYYPRSALVGAKASPASHLASLVTPPPSAALTVDGEGAAPQRAPGNNEGIMLEPENEPGKEREREAESGGESQAGLKFELCYYKINAELAVIDEIPHHSGEKSHSHSLALLRAILLALGVDGKDCQFKPVTFSWPLAAALEMKSEPALEARKALLGFIKKRQEIDLFRNLLIFAGQIDEILMLAEGGEDARDYQFANCSYYVTITSSLRSMLAYPMLKRDTWHHLQPLRQRLAGLDE